MKTYKQDVLEEEFNSIVQSVDNDSVSSMESAIKELETVFDEYVDESVYSCDVIMELVGDKLSKNDVNQLLEDFVGEETSIEIRASMAKGIGKLFIDLLLRDSDVFKEAINSQTKAKISFSKDLAGEINRYLEK